MNPRLGPRETYYFLRRRTSKDRSWSRHLGFVRNTITADEFLDQVEFLRCQAVPYKALCHERRHAQSLSSHSYRSFTRMADSRTLSRGPSMTARWGKCLAISVGLSGDSVSAKRQDPYFGVSMVLKEPVRWTLSSLLGMGTGGHNRFSSLLCQDAQDLLNLTNHVPDPSASSGIGRRAVLSIIVVLVKDTVWLEDLCRACLLVLAHGC